MRSLFATCAAVALTAVFALPAPAVAAEKRADGVRNVEQMDVSSQRQISPLRVSDYGPRYGYYRPYRSVLPTRRTTPMRRGTIGRITGRGWASASARFGFGIGF